MNTLSKPHPENSNIQSFAMPEAAALLVQWADADGNAIGGIVTLPWDGEQDKAEAVAAYIDALDLSLNPPPMPEPEPVEWVEPEPSLESKLYQAWKAMPVKQRSPFIPYWPAVNLALQIGDYEEARVVINAVTIPTELEPIREQFLAMIPK